MTGTPNAGGGRDPIYVRCYAVLLWIFPRSFRLDYTDDMVESFRAQSARARETGGRPAVMRYWLSAAADVPASAYRVRREIRKQHSLVSSGRWERVNGLRVLLDDLRQARRSLRKSPGVTGAALLILMLAIGGSTAVFSVLNAVLLRSLPYADAHELTVLWTVNTRQDLPDGTSYLNYLDWKQRSRTFEDMAMFTRPEFTTSTITSFGDPERVHVGAVTANLFQLLGVSPLVGRTLSERDLATDERVVVIGEVFWRQRYGGSTDVIGAAIHIDGEDYRVVGVVPSAVRIPRPTTQIWQLHDPTRGWAAQYRGNDAYVVLGRLRADATVETARAELLSIAAQLAEEYPETNSELGVSIRPLLAEITGERLPQVLWMLFGAVVTVLLVACTNVAHLMLARGAGRRRELAICAALGANRRRLIRQLLTESAVLGVLAGAGGVGLGYVALRTLLAFVPGDVPRLDQVGLDPTVLAMAIGVSVLAGPLFGLLPALANSRQDPAEALNLGGRGASNAHRRLRGVLVVAEVAMAVMLLAEAGLLVRSVRAIRAVDTGFDAQALLIAQVDLDFGKYDDAAQVEVFYREALDRIRAIPGVQSAGAIEKFFVERFPDQRITPVGREPADPGAPAPRLTTDGVYPGFFEAVDVPLLRGRRFTEADAHADTVNTVIVNQTMARTFWPDEDPAGESFRWGSRTEGPFMTVVGVVADMRRSALEEIAYPHIFRPAVQHSMDLAVRTSGDPLAITAALRSAIREIDATVPVSRVSTAWERYGDTMAQRQFQTLLIGLFSTLATLLAAIGLYALLHDAVNSRRREIGIRIALGAAPHWVRGMVLRQGVTLAAVGLVVGLLGAITLSTIVSSMLYGIAATDPTTLVFVSLLLLSVAAAASWIPARRATQVHPIETLVSE